MENVLTMLWGLTWQAWYTIILVVSLFLVLLFTKIRTDMVFLCTMVLFFIPGVLDISQAFGGFDSESVLVVAALFCVIAGLDNTGVLNWIVKYLLGKPKSHSGALVRIMAPVAFLSSFLSNTTVVALFVGIVKKWSKKLGISPSKLLIPLSYAAGMGGICTLIGTPPNLLISGMLEKETGIQLGVFAPFLCGIFCLFVGIVSMLLMRNLLPDRKTPLDSASDADFSTELKVPSNNIYIGRGIGDACNEAGIKFDSGKFVAIRRFDGFIVSPVDAEEPIMGGDHILVDGTAGELKMAAQRLGLENEYLETAVEQEGINRYSWKTLVSSLIFILAIVMAALKVMPLIVACMAAAVLMMVFGCCTPTQAYRKIDFGIIIVFASSIAIGVAIKQTGLAQMMADGLLGLCGTNPYVLLAVICLVATFITEFISNTAAGAIFFPIALSAAQSIGANPVTFCIALMISVSSSFATPIGSPTHMLVYTPGGYKFSDFLRLGLPMNLIILTANIIITPLVYPF